MISKSDVVNLANLARINIDENEVQSLQKELEVILNYVGQVSNLASSVGTKEDNIFNIIRDDIVTEKTNDCREEILRSFPEREGDYLKVKRILQ